MIYFDNAATSFPKPAHTVNEATDCMLHWCGNPGRGAHALSRRAADRLFACREALAALLGIRDPTRIVFLQNTTMALNVALKGLLRPGDHVLCSELEHNAVVRPLYALKAHGVDFDTFPVVGRTTEQILEGIRARRQKNTAAIVCLHTSNVCSIALPIAEIGTFCHENGLYFAVDAAQSAGHLAIDMEAAHIDLLAAPGHKGLLGLPGCGILALREGVHLSTIIEGGSGVNSLLHTMPEEMPERLEAGTLPVPAIAGLLGGLRFLSEIGIAEAQKRTQGLFLAARDRLEALPECHIYQRGAVGAVLLFNLRGIAPNDLARMLDREGIFVRAGLHCAPLAHQALGTPKGGAVRLSFGVFNTVEELDALWRALKSIL